MPRAGPIKEIKRVDGFELAKLGIVFIDPTHRPIFTGLRFQCGHVHLKGVHKFMRNRMRNESGQIRWVSKSRCIVVSSIKKSLGQSMQTSINRYLSQFKPTDIGLMIERCFGLGVQASTETKRGSKVETFIEVVVERLRNKFDMSLIATNLPVADIDARVATAVDLVFLSEKRIILVELKCGYSDAFRCKNTLFSIDDSIKVPDTHFTRFQVQVALTKELFMKTYACEGYSVETMIFHLSRGVLRAYKEEPDCVDIATRMLEIQRLPKVAKN